MRPYIHLAVAIFCTSGPVFAATKGKPTSSTASAGLKAPIAKDGSWALDIGSHAERRVLRLHALEPHARELYLVNPAPQAATVIPLAELADVYATPETAKARWVLTLRDGRVIEHPGTMSLGGPGLEPQPVHRFEQRGTSLTQTEIGAWRKGQLKLLMPEANLLTGEMWSQWGFTWMPLSKIAHFEAFRWSDGRHSVKLFDVDGHEYTMNTLELVNADDVDTKVKVDTTDPKWWPGGAQVTEQGFDDPRAEVTQLRRTLRKLLPTADRVIHTDIGSRRERHTPLAFLDEKSFGIHPHFKRWHVTVGGGSSASDTLAVADAQGNRIELDLAAGWATPRAKP